MNNRTVYLMAGISGSGKTRASRELIKGREALSEIISADDFMVDASGKWYFDPTKLSLCHSQCQENFHAALKRGKEVIIIDNPNLVRAHRDIYQDHALAAGYDVVTLVFDVDIPVALKRTVHGVPRHTLENQKRKLDLRPGIYRVTYESTAVAA